MKILGIDPGFATLGWAVIESNLKIIDFGIISTKPDLSIDERLLKIHIQINKIIKKYNPEYLALEQLFFSKNTKTAFDVAKCIGVILLTARINHLQYFEYTPSQVKTAITGYGRAVKGQIQNVTARIYNLKTLPGPDDIADALAVAACHYLNYNSQNLIYRQNISK